MNISSKQVTMVSLYDIINSHHLDPINITLENHAPGKGRITIQCFDKSWTAYWGGMGDNPVEAFFCSCGTSYLIGNLAPGMVAGVTDFEALSKLLKKGICEQRRKNELHQYDARELCEEAERVEYCEEQSELIHCHSKIMQTIIGDDWWHGLPEKPSNNYIYLKRIVEATQEGLRKYMKQSKQH